MTVSEQFTGNIGRKVRICVIFITKRSITSTHFSYFFVNLILDDVISGSGSNREAVDAVSLPSKNDRELARFTRG